MPETPNFVPIDAHIGYVELFYAEANMNVRVYLDTVVANIINKHGYSLNVEHTSAHESFPNVVTISRNDRLLFPKTISLTRFIGLNFIPTPNTTYTDTVKTPLLFTAEGPEFSLVVPQNIFDMRISNIQLEEELKPTPRSLHQILDVAESTELYLYPNAAPTETFMFPTDNSPYMSSPLFSNPPIAIGKDIYAKLAHYPSRLSFFILEFLADITHKNLNVKGNKLNAARAKKYISQLDTVVLLELVKERYKRITQSFGYRISDLELKTIGAEISAGMLHTLGLEVDDILVEYFLETIKPMNNPTFSNPYILFEDDDFDTKYIALRNGENGHSLLLKSTNTTVHLTPKCYSMYLYYFNTPTEDYVSYERPEFALILKHNQNSIQLTYEETSVQFTPEEYAALKDYYSRLRVA